MYKIKSIPEDFVVDEIYNLPEDGKAVYSYFVLSKRNMNTIDALTLVSRKLGIPFSSIGYAGLKDKSSISSQLVSIRGIRKERLENLQVSGISARYVGKGAVPVTLGSHEGNMFTIIVRNIPESAPAFKSPFLLPNYFGSQRFSRSNHVIGKCIVKGNFEEVCRQISGNQGMAVQDCLREKKNDFVGALGSINKSKMTLYVHSYQAFIFNLCALSYLKSRFSGREVDDSAGGKLFFPDSIVENKPLPLIGFATELNDSDISLILQGIMKKEQVSLRDFVIRKIPYLSCEGADRDLMMEVKNFSCEFSDDDHNEGMKKCIVRFSLPKGSYATVLLACLFG